MKKVETKKVLIAIGVLVLLCALIIGLKAWSDNRNRVELKATVGILVADDIESNQVVLGGFKDLLKSHYPLDGEIVYIEKEAKGDASKYDTFIQEMLDANVDAIVTLGDEASKAAVDKGLSVPVFFLGSSDPVAAGLTSSLEAPDKNATGAVAFAPIDKMLEQIPKLVTVNTYGIIYNENNATSKASAEFVMKKMDEAGISHNAVSISASEEAADATAQLIETCDGIFLIESPEVDNAVIDIVAAAGDKPVFACNQGSVMAGAVLAVGMNMRDVGRDAGMAVHQYLTGTPIKEIPVKAVPGVQTYVNHGKAIELGYTVNDEFMNTAELINRVEVPVTEAPTEEAVAE